MWTSWTQKTAFWEVSPSSELVFGNRPPSGKQVHVPVLSFGGRTAAYSADARPRPNSSTGLQRPYELGPELPARRLLICSP